MYECFGAIYAYSLENRSKMVTYIEFNIANIRIRFQYKLMPITLQSKLNTNMKYEEKIIAFSIRGKYIQCYFLYFDENKFLH